MRYAPVEHPSKYNSEKASARNLKIGLTHLVRHLTSAGKSVFLVEDNPIFDFDPVRWTVTQKLPVRLQLEQIVSYDPVDLSGRSSIVHVVNYNDVSNTFVHEVQAAIAGVQIVDPFVTLCAKAECAFANPRGLYYFDEQHLSTLGATIALRSLRISTAADGIAFANTVPGPDELRVASAPRY